MQYSCLLLAFVFGWSLTGSPSPEAVSDKASAGFRNFVYEGIDPSCETDLPNGHYRNPILSGFHPDPTVCRVGDDYYLACSSFAWYPGVPLFHSRDLVNWRQIGHILDRPSQLDLDGLQVSQGIFAPALRYHDGTFYMITTLVGKQGNFIVTAQDPEGPWSDPVWLPELDGIDPSLFFEEDGRVWIVHNGPPPGNESLYDGHRAIWLWEYDPVARKVKGEGRIIVNGGVDLSRQPIWIEAPHLFRKDGVYYLICAEGGTRDQHSEVVFRAESLDGPFVPWERNPILTQRDLPPDRTLPVTSTGHADFVQTPGGDWWAVFLGCRPYEGDRYATGRETFLLPVNWVEEGKWPVILESGVPVPLTHPCPHVDSCGESSINSPSKWEDRFDSEILKPEWNMLRTPVTEWFRMDATQGVLRMDALEVGLWDFAQPAFLARRLQHRKATVSVWVDLPSISGISQGLVAFQNETHHFFLGLRRVNETQSEVFVERAEGGMPEEVLSTVVDELSPCGLRLRMELDDDRMQFSYNAGDTEEWTPLGASTDATLLTTEKAGGFVGTYLGIHVRTDR